MAAGQPVIFAVKPCWPNCLVGESANDLCGGTITVNKLFDADGTLATTGDQTPEKGWRFDAEAAGGSVLPESAETDDAGSIVFAVEPDGTIVDVREAVGGGWVLLDASCVGATDNGSSNHEDAVTGIVVGAEDRVVCTFINTADSLSGG